MTIGGWDISIEIPPHVSAAEVILRLMRRRWPGSYFQDADRDDFYPIGSEHVAIRGGLSREFFVFVDLASLESWHRDGATAENANAMLHFLVGEPTSRRGLRLVTLVCDEPSGSILGLRSDIEASFLSSRRPTPQNDAA